MAATIEDAAGDKRGEMQQITAGGMLDLSKQALAHTADLTPGEASEL